MTTLYVDTETFSECDLPKCGGWVYSRHPTTECLLITWAVDDEPVRCETPGPIYQLMRAGFLLALQDPSVTLIAHNSQFDRWIIENVLGIPTDITRWRDTMAKAYTMGLPGALGQLAASLNLDDDSQKITDGKRLIRKFCMPQGKNRKITRHTAQTDPEDWQKFVDYAIRDTDALRAIDKAIPGWNYKGDELALWHLDQKINDRGLPIDVPLARRLAHVCDAEVARMNAELAELTGGAVTANTQRDRTLAWLREQGVYTEGFRKADVAELLARDDLPDNARRVIEIRQEAGRSSTAKYVRIGQTVDPKDHRIRGGFQYGGAMRTLRWCLTGEHEVLTETGWQRLDQWQGGSIAQWRDGRIEFRDAKRVAFEYNGLLTGLHRANRISARMTPEHRLCVEGANCTAGTAFGRNIAGIPRSGVLHREPCSTIRTRALVMLQHDGYDGTAHGGGVAWGFRKRRKYTRCLKLLASAGVPFHKRERSDGSLHVWVRKSEAPSWLRKQDFGPWLLEEKHDPRVFVDEIQHWDGGGRRHKQLEVCCKDRVNAEWTCTMAHLAGYVGSLTQRANGYWFACISYAGNGVSIKPNDWFEENFSGTVFCPVTASGYFLVRHRGVVHVTGNSGRHVQFQNLPRPTLDGDAAAEAVLNGTAEMLYDNLMEVGASCLRSTICAPAGRKLVVGDYAGIESRVLAWLAGESWKLDAFREIDEGIGAGIYQRTYARCFSVVAEDIEKGTPEYQAGKTLELGSGFQGAVGAVRSMAANLGVTLPDDDETIIGWVRAWRKANPRIVAWWYQLEEAAIQALRTPGRAFSAGTVSFKVVGKWLLCRLPSGRFLCHYGARLVQGGKKIQFQGLELGKWRYLDTYGGSLAQSITQATARDLMAHNMPLAEKAGYEIIGTVHDEIITEVDESFGSLAGLEAGMGNVPPWAEGLPVTVEAWEGKRYRK